MTIYISYKLNLRELLHYWFYFKNKESFVYYLKMGYTL